MKSGDKKNQNKVRVLIVDDSATARRAIANVLGKDPAIEVIGFGVNGKEAVALTAQLRPHIITMDIQMPDMDGLEATEQIMAFYPTPVAIVTASLSHKGRDFVYQALDAGAIEVIQKPALLSDFGPEFPEKIKLLARVPVITHLSGRRKARLKMKTIDIPEITTTDKVIGIVASTGGPDALRRVLSALPEDFPACILIVQHIGKGFEHDLIGWLRNFCRLPIVQAEHRTSVEKGVIYFAPSGYHTTITNERIIELNEDPPVWGHKPSGDILLTSLAAVYKKNAIGVILTGMGRDGANGIQSISNAGGVTIAQDEATSLIFGMPKVAIEMQVVNTIAPIDQIAEMIIKELKT
jgi:two-component system chemotaxis response regulator CheB